MPVGLHKKLNMTACGCDRRAGLNVKLNMTLFERAKAKKIYIFPAMGDAGAGLGALVKYLREKKKINYNYFKNNNYVMPYWGNEYQKDTVQVAGKDLDPSHFSKFFGRDMFSSKQKSVT